VKTPVQFFYFSDLCYALNQPEPGSQMISISDSSHFVAVFHVLYQDGSSSGGAASLPPTPQKNSGNVSLTDGKKETTSCTDEAASPADNLIIHHLAKTQTTDEEFFFSIVALWTIFPRKKPCRAHPKEYSEQFINNSRVVDVTTEIKSLPSFLLRLSYKQHLTSAVCQCSQEINLASSLTASNERGDNQNS
jgi:hypothetical protein